MDFETDSSAPARAIVQRHYPPECVPRDCRFLGGAGGFSGSRLWRLTSPAGELCLRRWPSEHPSADRLAFIHSVLFLADRNGYSRLPLPIRTRSGDSFLAAEGHLWELTPWIPGAADFHARPSDERLTAALRALAEFHVSVASHPAAPHDPAPSPGLGERTQQLRALTAGDLFQLAASIRRAPAPRYDDLAERILARLPDALESAGDVLIERAELAVPLQPAIRDVWHDHLFFVGDEVSGIVDFGSLRIDSVCGDVARLLGSLSPDDDRARQVGLAAYESVRPLSDAERRVLPAFELSALPLSGVNWLDWLYRAGRRFEDPTAVRRRLGEIAQRLEQHGPRP